MVNFKWFWLLKTVICLTTESPVAKGIKQKLQILWRKRNMSESKNKRKPTLEKHRISDEIPISGGISNTNSTVSPSVNSAWGQRSTSWLNADVPPSIAVKLLAHAHKKPKCTPPHVNTSSKHINSLKTNVCMFVYLKIKTTRSFH